MTLSLATKRDIIKKCWEDWQKTQYTKSGKNIVKKMSEEEIILRDCLLYLAHFVKRITKYNSKYKARFRGLLKVYFISKKKKDFATNQCSN